MKVIALEEHFVTSEVDRLGSAVEPRWRDASAGFMPPGSDMAARLHDLGDERIRLMDESGIDVQVLSLTTRGVQNLEPGDARDAASRANDLIAATVARPIWRLRHAAHARPRSGRARAGAQRDPARAARRDDLRAGAGP